jgi:exonuclease VII large subunit
MAKAGGKSKTSPDQNPKSSQSNVEMADGGSVDKIRDILFGNQMRDFERRFSQMEDRLDKATKDLRDETHKRLEALERFFKKEQAALKDRLKSESDKREDEDKKLNDDLKHAVSSLKKELHRAEEKLLELNTELRQQILEQSKTLFEEIQDKNEQSSEALRKTAQGLDDAKIDRSTMAEYLIDMAMRISDHGGEVSADQ